MKQNKLHVAIILDGNRRFAKKFLLEPWKGHEYGANSVKKLIDYSAELGIRELTLYCLSLENLKNRAEKELDYLFRIFSKEFENLMEKENQEKINKAKIGFRFIGNLDLLPASLMKKCKEIEKETGKNSGLIINFMIAYGGRQEIVNAVKKIINKKIRASDVDEDVITKNLLISDEPDLIIRTGGEKRTSNFLPWQSVYSEWIFLNKMWPEFNRQDLINCIEEFRRRKRNFGR